MPINSLDFQQGELIGDVTKKKTAQAVFFHIPRNTAPTATEPIKVYPREWQHEWIEKNLAADIAKSAQTVKPSADDLALSSIRYA